MTETTNTETATESRVRTLPLVSIIVRTKDRPDVLVGALDSIAEQSYPNIEIVVVNDGGEDVAGLVESFEPRVTSVEYIDLGENRGRVVAANTGLDKAAGAYLGFLDDDDWFRPEHVASLVAELERSPEIGLAYAGVECVRENADGESETVFVFKQPYDPIRLLVENYIPMHAPIFRRELVDAGCRLDESLALYEDWDFWVQLAQRVEFKLVDQITAVYRIAGSGGFGIAGNAASVRQALEIFFDKWRSRWTPAQLLRIAEYAKHRHLYNELRERHREEHLRLQELRNAVTKLSTAQSDWGRERAQMQQDREQMQREREQMHREREQMQRERDQWSQERSELRERQVELTRQLAREQRLAAAGAQRVAQLEASTSWRVTAPLRGLSVAVRAPLHRLRTGSSRVLRYGALSYQILRIEGPGRLLERIRDKFAGRHSPPALLATVHELDVDVEPLQIERIERPRVSVVISVHGAARYLFTCLKSLLGARESVDWEIIAVPVDADADALELLHAMPGVRELAAEGGVLAACDAGARAAGGDILLFLADTAKVVEGTVPGLLETFTAWSDAGLVGVRVVSRDGRLQQAGGIAWRDGSLTWYGAGDDPAKPQYNYVREVDYVSAVCLAVRRELYLEVGGFNAGFDALEYETVDLALRIRNAGRRVLYQPGFTVVDFGASEQGNASRSPDWEQTRAEQQRGFAHRWNGQLVSHRLPDVLPELERDRAARRRLLVMDAVRLMPDRDSGSLRMWYLLGLFQELGFKVTFVASNLEHGEEYGTRLQQRGIEVLYHPFVYSIEEYLKTNGRYFDIVLLSRALVAEQFLKIARALAPQAVLVFDTVDLHFLREERMAALEGHSSMAMAAQLRKEKELELAETADVTVVVSDVEKEILLRERPQLEVDVISNIHEVYGSAASFADRQGIVFIGGFNHPPNTDAVMYYVQDILPLIRRHLGPVTTYIVGDKPPPKIKALASETVIVTGYVPELAPYLDRARLTVAPLRYGAGVKGKVNMSMAHGVPVVATPMAVEGMYLNDGDDVVIGEDAESFAQGVVRLYGDEALWQRISTNGLRNVESYFSLDTARRALKRIVQRHGLV